MRDENMIPAIHNWCDRWCERCPFLDRCSVGVMEKRRWEKGHEPDEEELWHEVHENFQEALRMLDEMIREAGLDPIKIDGEPLQNPDPDLEALGKVWFDKGIRYYKSVQAFLQDNMAFFNSKNIELERQVEMQIPVDLEGWNELADAIEIIRQYGSFISVKGRRAISGLESINEDYWESPQQSDANGSAKITMITIERSLGAWEMLRKHWPEKTNEIIDLLVQLSRLRQEMVELFPDWKQFVRPGFDTEPPQFARFEPN